MRCLITVSILLFSGLSLADDRADGMFGTRQITSLNVAQAREGSEMPGEVLDLSGSTATVRWNDSGEEAVMEQSELRVADDQIVSGRIDLGRCMFCGLCMEACGFTSFFMTNEYDGMSGFSRQALGFDASRTRVLPSVHQEAVDGELAKRATKERDKRAKKAAKAAKAAEEGA